MADVTVTKIALAGLLHDIGKFAQGSIDITPQYRQNNEDIYQPKYDGHPTHVHALYTAAFLEQVRNLLPPELSARQWGEGEIEDTFLNLAACHHSPKTPLQWIITAADRISSGLDRATFDEGEKIAFKDYKRTRLLPVLESLGPKKIEKFKKADDFTFRYPLAPLSAHTIFPCKCHEVEKKEAEQEYQTHFELFRKQMANVRHQRENVSLWAEHFDSLLMTFTSMIPAARVGDVIHDVSLYDHSRTTAALAAALYRFHAATGTMEETSVRKGDKEKLLLVSGDFYGIQDFIFSAGGEMQKFRSKLLRGRSFAVSLFSELAADLLCQKLDLPFLSVVMNAAGKFHLIAPNLPEAIDAIKEAETIINDWLFASTYGQSSLGISATPATPNDFHAEAFADLWERHQKNVDIRKACKVDLNRHGGAVEDYLDSFINDETKVRRPLCPLCGKRPSTITAENDLVFKPDNSSSCDLCRDHVFLGKNLVKNPLVAICKMEKSGLKDDNCLLSPIFGQYQIGFTSNSNNFMEKQAASGTLLKLWQVKANEDGSLPAEATARLINGHVPLYDDKDNKDECLLESARSEEKLMDFIEQIKNGVPKTFSHIAVKARHRDENGKCRGVEALGVLKADVDNLGMLFGCGLSRKRFTISRVATVSRQLNNFFVLYLPHLLATEERFYNTYTVFAGGDDLFLIGPWNRMADLATHLNQRFAEYVCGNNEITFSAGITVHKAHSPVDKMAEAAEEALKMAKRKEKDEKNRVTMFGETVTWKDFNTLLQARTNMEGWLAQKYIGDAMFYRFNHFVTMAEMEKLIMEEKTVDLEDMDSLKWRALFKYSLVRNINRKRAGWEKSLTELEVMAAWLENYRGALRIPLWHVIYEKRK
ncbi:MAG: type III-A CRISPR-associated protein Cas10/Csm1 [Desulfoarculaceae bacterium]|nr:type III-A CRISPR-associated protein Cas10/Csm1 [Desulfoarculaceae bacterium]